MREEAQTFYTFSSSAANAVTIIANFCNLPRKTESPQVDVQRIEQLQKLADELEKGISDAKRILEESPPLADLEKLQLDLASLREKYLDCLQQWRKERGQEFTPPILWRRLQEAKKSLRDTYQNVQDSLEDLLDLEDFRAAKEEWERDGRKTIPWEKVKSDLGL